MNIPFSVDEFFNVFENYNRSLWPIQIVFYILALLAVALILKKGRHSSRIVMSILSLFWLWMGVVYHLLYFSPINKAAFLFGLVFIVQSFIFLYVGVIKGKVQVEFNLNISGVVALLLLLYSLIIYPIVGYSMGHVYPRTPTFGVPCPTTIFTFAVLLYSVQRISWYLLIIPLLWSIVGFSAAVNLSVKEDFGLVVAGVVSSGILLFYKPKSHKAI